MRELSLYPQSLLAKLTLILLFFYNSTGHVRGGGGGYVRSYPTGEVGFLLSCISCCRCAARVDLRRIYVHYYYCRKEKDNMDTS